MTAERDAYRSAAAGVATALALTGGVGVGVAWGVVGTAGAAAAAVGAILALVTMLSGPAAMLVALKRAPRSAPNVALVASLGGLVLAVAVFVWASSFGDDARVAFAATFGVGVVLGMIVKVVAAARARVPYVDPREGRG